MAKISLNQRRPPHALQLRRGWRTLCRFAAMSTLGLVTAAALGGCSIGLRSAVSMKLNRAKATPRDASVYIDEEFIGPLYYVAAHGVRLPTGKHRISITRDGYFPWDRLVEADRQPIAVDVELVPVPD
jgi:hypothetical protein